MARPVDGESVLKGALSLAGYTSLPTTADENGATGLLFPELVAWAFARSIPVTGTSTTAGGFWSARAVGDGYVNSPSPPSGPVFGVNGHLAGEGIAFMPYSFGQSIAVKNAQQAAEFHLYNSTSVGYVPVLYMNTTSSGNEVQIRYKPDTNCIRLVFPDTGDPFISTEAVTTNLAIKPTGDLILWPTGNVEVRNSSGIAGTQEFRYIGNYVDASNYDRLRLRYDSGNSRYALAGEALGSQLLRDLFIGTGTSLGTNVLGKDLILAPGSGTGSSGGGSVRFQYAAAGSSGTTANTLADAWFIDGVALKAAADDTFNIGTPTTNRPRNIYASFKVTTPTITLTTAATSVSAGQVSLGATVAATASAGAAGAPPAQVLGYLIANVAGTGVKIPYYAT